MNREEQTSSVPIVAIAATASITNITFCPDSICTATPPWYGTLSGYYIIASDFAYLVPDHMNMKEAVLVKFVSVAVQIANLADLRAGQTVLVFGCILIEVS